MATAPVCRAYREGDETAIIRAFAGESGIHRSLDEWAWLYPAEELGRAVVIAEADGEVVAHCGGVPLRLAVDDAEWAGVRLADLFSSTDPAGAPGSDLMERVGESFVETFGSPKCVQFIIGFSTLHEGESMEFSRCFGTPESLQFPAFTRERAPLSTPRRFLYRAEAARDWEPRLDQLWARVRRHYPAAVVRDAARALRRFAGHPTVRFQKFLIFPRFSGRAVGFACFRCDEGRCRWVDLLWDHRHPGALDLLAHISARLVGQFGCAGEVVRLAGDDETIGRLEALGFRRSEDPAHLRVVFLASDAGLDAGTLLPRMYLTPADTGMV